jgi:anti-sigma B factor antagonist
MSEQQGAITVIRLGGPRLAHTECDTVKESVSQLLRAGNLRIVLDFSDVEFIDSTMIGTLVASINRINSAGGRVVACHLTPSLERLLAILHLEKLFTVAPTVAEARRLIEG